jgi:LysR family transcriptional regulator, hypochlorite-specific transcription factor HypT
LELAWLEDFLALDVHRSFSHAAQERYVSQPAFSRRIQALEDWFGATLIDRSTSPVSLTPKGKNFRQYALQVVRQSHDTRQFFKAQNTFASRVVRFTVAHTLVTSFFPNWYPSIQDLLSKVGANAHVNAMNVVEGAKALQEGEADFFVSFHHEQISTFLDPERFTSFMLGRDSFLPFSAVVDGRQSFVLDPSQKGDIPYLAYAPGTFFAQVVDMLHFKSRATLPLEKIFQTQMAEGIKAMVLAGHGVGWLPSGCVSAETAQGHLKAIGDEALRTGLEIRIYRASIPQNAAIEALWKHLIHRPVVS